MKEKRTVDDLTYVEWLRIYDSVRLSLIPARAVINLAAINRRLSSEVYSAQLRDCETNPILQAITSVQHEWVYALFEQEKIVALLKDVAESKWIEIYTRISHRIVTVAEQINEESTRNLHCNIRLVLKELDIVWEPSEFDNEARYYDRLLEEIPSLQQICFGTFKTE